MNPAELKQRQEQYFETSKTDSLLLCSFSSSPDPNFQYFAGIQGKDFMLCLRKNRKPLILASNLEAGNVKKSEFYNSAAYNSSKELVSLLRKALGKKVGLNFAVYPVKNFQNLQKLLKGRKFTDAFEDFAKLREKKSEFEVSKIKEACKVSEMGADYFENFFKQGMTEIEVSEKLKGFFERMNCQSAFEPIVAFGENSSIPHHECSRKRVEGNGLLLLDFGAKFEGYCSDISRTYFVGKPSVELMEKYHLIYEAKKLAQSLLIPGQKAAKISKEVDAFLQKRLGQKLQHSLGHGIGLEEHDFPSGLNSFADWKISENQCLAIEPAFYCKEYGIRIEDDCCISAQGAKMLTAAPRELLTV